MITIFFKICCCLGATLLTRLLLAGAKKDMDFAVDGNPIAYSRTCKTIVCAAVIFSCVVIILSPTQTATFYGAVTFPYLITCAVTDHYTRLTYSSGFWALALLSAVMEFATSGTIYSILIYAISGLMGITKAYGLGDCGMASIAGGYLAATLSSEQMPFLCDAPVGWIGGQLIAIMIAEIIFVIIQIKNKNMKSAVELKKPAPLGPSLAVGTAATIAVALFQIYL